MKQYGLGFLNSCKKGFSLVEVVVSIGIMSVAMLILMSTLITAYSVNIKTLAANFVREEISALLSSITRDIRNANSITSCSGSDCLIETQTGGVRWSLCGAEPDNTRVCKYNELDEIVYQTSNNVVLTNLDFTVSVPLATVDPEQANLIVTIVGSHANTNLGINNILKQNSVSTRNFNL